jgi:hypothetical protein
MESIVITNCCTAVLGNEEAATIIGGDRVPDDTPGGSPYGNFDKNGKYKPWPKPGPLVVPPPPTPLDDAIEFVRTHRLGLA